MPPTFTAFVTPWCVHCNRLVADFSGESSLNFVDVENDASQAQARVAWEYGLEVRRDHPLIGQFGAALGMTAAAIDAAFREAAEIQ